MADLVPRRESSDLMTLRDAVDRLFQESFVRPFSTLFPASARGAMALDVYDQDDAVVVEVTVPGVKPEDIDVRITGDVLSIRAESKQEKTISEDRYSYKERSYGVMQRSITLPASVDPDKAEAKLEHGVLKLTLPKVEQQKARQIKVTGK
jgi:HSP20 family protein